MSGRIRTLCCRTPEDLDTAVNELLSAGYVIYGNLQVTALPDRWIFRENDTGKRSPALRFSVLMLGPDPGS